MKGFQLRRPVNPEYRLPSFAQLAIISDKPSSMGFVPTIIPDPDNSYEIWLWNELRGKTLGEWIELKNYHCDERPLYGEKPYERKSKMEQSYDEYDKSEKQRVKDAEHRTKEQERRVRHRVWQGIIDFLTGDSCNRLAVTMMSRAKEEFGHQPKVNEARNGKETGKDEQLLSAIFAMILSNWIIQVQSELLFSQDLDRQRARCDCSAVSNRRKRPMLAFCDRKSVSSDEFLPCVL